MSPLSRRAAFAGTLVACAVLAAAQPAAGCPFCAAEGKTLTADANEASLILFGKLTNARLDPKDSFAGQTDLEVETVVKSHAILAGRKVVTLPRYLPPDPDYKFLVFCDVYKGQIDPYRGEAVKADSRIAAYLKGALAVKDKDATTRLKYFFDYLEDKDPAVSGDAYKEFGFADYKDYRAVAEKLPADAIARWLKDPNTPPSRLGLYASMLGHCGKTEHAKLLRTLLDDPQRRFTSGMDGMMAGYVLLQPKDGWAFLAGLMRDAKLDFGVRYAALRAARFFHEFRPDLVPPADLTGAVVALLDQKDIADLAIEDLRKWGCWEVADKVLGLYGKESHNVPIIRRAILRYALTCPASASPKAAAFVAERRKDSAKLLDEVQEILNLESPRPAATAAAPAAPAKPGK
ncbi:MAG TPA: hypothetical protein VGF55_18895 [Gemmataceae bacterium]